VVLGSFGKEKEDGQISSRKEKRRRVRNYFVVALLVFDGDERRREDNRNVELERVHLQKKEKK
jgi:hypothetical protein